MADIKLLDKILEDEGISFEINKYQAGYRYGEGTAKRFIKPTTNEQVAKIMAYCNDHHIPVVTQGGNTGLVGNSTADTSNNQIVLSTSLLNKDLLQITDNKVHVGAGVILDSLNAKLAYNKLFFPVDIGSSGSCTIGGLIATNAAGGRAGCYGNVKSRTCQITVVLPNGDIKIIDVKQANNKNALPQDNSYIDINNPFIGSQGWLGVITSAVIKLEQLPVACESMMLAPGDIKAIPAIKELFMAHFGKNLSAFEIIDVNALKLVAKNIPDTQYLFANEQRKIEVVLLVEVFSNVADSNLQEDLLVISDKMLRSDLIITGLIGKSHLYWQHRHHISEAAAKEGLVIATDIAIENMDKFAEFCEQTTLDLTARYPDIKIVYFGHYMLNAVHFNVIWPKQKNLDDVDKRNIQQMIYDKIIYSYRGTFSVEHGIGAHNQWAYDRYIAGDIKDAARLLKNKFDPNAIMNPNLYYSYS
jgi:FAD/FMN-containing dehydrogenase